MDAQRRYLGGVVKNIRVFCLMWDSCSVQSKTSELAIFFDKKAFFAVAYSCIIILSENNHITIWGEKTQKMVYLKYRKRAPQLVKRSKTPLKNCSKSHVFFGPAGRMGQTWRFLVASVYCVIILMKNKYITIWRVKKVPTVHDQKQDGRCASNK